jgi:hypothetical protein
MGFALSVEDQVSSRIDEQGKRNDAELSLTEKPDPHVFLIA